MHVRGLVFCLSIGALVVLYAAGTSYAEEHSAKEPITNITCSIEQPCPEGLLCVSFPGLGLRCASEDPCGQFDCPEGKTCVLAESYPPRVICAAECRGAACEQPVSHTPDGE